MSMFFIMLMGVSIFGSFLMGSVIIWALVAKRERLPMWAKVVLGLLLFLGVIILIACLVGFFSVFGDTNFLCVS